MSDIIMNTENFKNNIYMKVKIELTDFMANAPKIDKSEDIAAAMIVVSQAVLELTLARVKWEKAVLEKEDYIVAMLMWKIRSMLGAIATEMLR